MGLRSKLTAFLNKRLYSARTNYMLNYLTLEIKDESCRLQLVKHQGEQMNRVFWPVALAIHVNLVVNLFTVFVFKTADPLVLLVTLSIEIMFFILWLMKCTGRIHLFHYLILPYFFVCAIGSTIVSKGWLVPASQSITSKSDYQFQLLTNFILLNAVPLSKVKFTLFGMVPVLLIATYIQASMQV